MMALIILVIGVALSIPYWLGIVPEKIYMERRFLARATLAGLAAGLLFNASFTLLFPDEDPSQLLMVANGGAVGSLIGFLGILFMRVRKITGRPKTVANEVDPL